MEARREMVQSVKARSIASGAISTLNIKVQYKSSQLSLRALQGAN